MYSDFIKNINWVDILLVAIFVRVVFIGFRRGFAVEFFKILGVLTSVFVTLHYFSAIASFLTEAIRLPAGISECLAFTSLWVLVTIIFKFIREGFLLLFKIEAHSLFERWGSLLFSFARGAVICSLTVLCIHSIDMEYFNLNLGQSYSGAKIAEIAPKIYAKSFEGFVVKFFPTENLNPEAAALSVLESSDKDHPKKKKKM